MIIASKGFQNGERNGGQKQIEQKKKTSQRNEFERGEEKGGYCGKSANLPRERDATG